MVKAAIRKKDFAIKQINTQTKSFIWKNPESSKFLSSYLNFSANNILNIKKKQKAAKRYSKVQWPNRCWATGKAGGVYQIFGLSRHALRNFARNCLLVGLVKSSW